MACGAQTFVWVRPERVDGLFAVAGVPGDTFATTLRNGGLDIFLVGVCITTLTSLATLIIGHRVLKVPMGYLIGVLAGLQTQPAVLAYATEQAGEELPNLGYAAVYPMAMISKIILAQVLVILLT